jgi:hypothetical protein
MVVRPVSEVAWCHGRNSDVTERTGMGSPAADKAVISRVACSPLWERLGESHPNELLDQRLR